MCADGVSISIDQVRVPEGEVKVTCGLVRKRMVDGTLR